MYLPKTSQIKGINLFYEHNKKKKQQKTYSADLSSGKHKR